MNTLSFVFRFVFFKECDLAFGFVAFFELLVLFLSMTPSPGKLPDSIIAKKTRHCEGKEGEGFRRIRRASGGYSIRRRALAIAMRYARALYHFLFWKHNACSITNCFSYPRTPSYNTSKCLCFGHRYRYTLFRIVRAVNFRSVRVFPPPQFPF